MRVKRMLHMRLASPTSPAHVAALIDTPKKVRQQTARCFQGARAGRRARRGIKTLDLTVEWLKRGVSKQAKGGSRKHPPRRSEGGSPAIAKKRAPPTGLAPREHGRERGAGEAGWGGGGNSYSARFGVRGGWPECELGGEPLCEPSPYPLKPRPFACCVPCRVKLFSAILRPSW
jgi:hypothetical protein